MNISRKDSGFTLIEIMVTVAIVAILASIALPGYQDQIRKARRADVMDLLTDCAAAQARNYSTASPPSYLNRAGLVANNLCDGSSGAAPGQLLSKDGYYSISQVQNPNCVGAPGTNWCFTLIATPTAGSSQLADTECLFWSIDHRDNKTANSNPAPAGGAAATDTTRQCWRS